MINVRNDGPSPERSLMRGLISQWEYRHLRAFATVRLISGSFLVGLGGLLLFRALTLTSPVIYALATVVLLGGALDLALGYWEVTIAGSASGRT